MKFGVRKIDKFVKNKLRIGLGMNFLFLTCLNVLQLSARVLLLSILYLIVYFIVYEFIHLKSIKSMLFFNIIILNVAISLVYLLDLIVFYMQKDLLILSLVFVCAYFIVAYFAKRQVKKMMHIEIDDKGLKFGKIVVGKGGGVPLGVAGILGAWAGTWNIELTLSTMTLFTFGMFCMLIFFVYYAYFQLKYCIVNELQYVYQGSKSNK